MHCEALESLALNIRQEERNAEILLPMFDIEFVANSQQGELLPTLSNDLNSFYPGCSPNPRTDLDTRSLSLAHSSENPFLSTPLRLKHFSRLSPTLLRELLRSPSIRQETPENSYTSNISQLPQLPKPVHSLDWPLFGYDSGVFPPSPPPTAQLPALDQFPSGQDPGIIDHQTHTATSGDASKQELDPEDFIWQSDRLVTEIETSPQNLCLCPSVLPCLILHANPLLSSSVLRNFRRVINELQGKEDNPDERRRTLVSSLRMSVFPNSSLIDIHSPSSRTTVQPNIELVHPPLICEGQRPVHHLDQEMPLRTSLKPLKEEFVGLLLRRAMEEDSDASQLRMLSGRLEKIAEARRHLARLYRQMYKF